MVQLSKVCLVLSFLIIYSSFLQTEAFLNLRGLFGGCNCPCRTYTVKRCVHSYQERLDRHLLSDASHILWKIVQNQVWGKSQKIQIYGRNPLLLFILILICPAATMLTIRTRSARRIQQFLPNM